MSQFNKFFISILLILLTSCGGGGDTKTLKQSVEQNKLNITSIVLKSKYTQTIDLVNTPGTTPTYYFTHGDTTEQITVTGINDKGEEISLSNIDFSIIDNSGGSATTIDDNGNLSLETLANNTSKQITVQAEFGSLIGTATVMISAFHLQAGGLLLYVNGAAANASHNATVCDTTLFEARGVYDDGSTRTLTRKVAWAASNADTNAKFNVTDLNKPLFSSHTNATYTLNVTHDAQTTNVDIVVAQTGFSNMLVSPLTKTLVVNGTQLLSLSATINSQTKTNLEDKAKWTTADAGIADVNSATGVVTGKAIGGPVLVTGTCGTDTKISSITVKALELVSTEIRNSASNAISKLTFNLTAGTPQTHRLTLFAHYSDGSEANISSETTNITWTIDLLTGGVGAITVDGNGTVTATLAGSALVTAVYKGKIDTVGIEVKVN